MAARTSEQFGEVIDRCRSLFAQKTADYGTAWRVLRPSSLTDQLYIKAQRIRSVQEKGEAKVAEPIEDGLIALVNYSVMALIQLELKNDPRLELPAAEAVSRYDEQVTQIKSLMDAKNHDYGEAWRDLRVSSMVDIILMKLLRIRQIEDQNGLTRVSEGADAGYQDIVNYAVFSLIHLSETKNAS